MSDTPKTPKKKSNLIYNILLVAFAAGFLYGGYRLFDIYYHYHQADAEYSKLESTYVKPMDPEKTAAIVDNPEQEEEAAVNREFPALEVDFGSLLAENEDVVGWLYVDFCEVSFPVVQGPNNDYYLHRTVEGTNNRAGSIFMDYENTPDFSDMNTFIYGHNMKNGSMFGPLKALREEGGEELRKAYPYFYIFLADQTVRKYQIFSYYVTGDDSDSYVLFDSDSEYDQYIKKITGRSMEVIDMDFSERPNIISLSTCANDAGTTRFIIHGAWIKTFDLKEPEEGEE